MKSQNNDIKIGIYKIISPNNKVYIGQSVDIDKRWMIHKGIYELEKYTKLKNSLLKYGIENHKFEIIEECYLSQLDQKEAFYKRKFIKEFGWDKALFHKIKDYKGGKLDELTKIKIGNANKGKVISQETRDKLSNKLKGRIISWEKGGLKNKDIKRTDKFIENLIKIKSISILQYDLEGNFIKEWESLKLASIPLNIHPNNIGSVLKNKTKTAGGFKWKYKL